MKLIADSGSTKTDWCVMDGSRVVQRMAGQGINPFQQSPPVILKTITDDVVSKITCAGDIDEVYFYGAGCREEMKPMMRGVLPECFPGAVKVDVETDMLGAARALFADEPGIACILGTGANSCMYDGKNITGNVPPLGYILGDEGSGAVLGKLFVNAMFKGGVSDAVRNGYLSESGLTLADIINRVYREPLPNRFLASMSLYVHRHLDDERVRRLVVDNFRNFFRRNVALYSHDGYAVGCVGSMAYCYGSQLAEAARMEGFEVAKVLKSPMEGLVAYHSL